MNGLIQTVVAILLASLVLIPLAGGIVAGILRARGRQRLQELAYRERIAAIERGLDPSTLPPVIPPDAWMASESGEGSTRRYLVIGGVLLATFGGALAIVMSLIEPGQGKWIVGIIPAATGGGLLLCERLWHTKR
jgi:hypothetical protein